MIRLTPAQVLAMHRQLIEASGGSPGMRDENLLISAVSAPFQTYGEQELYPTLQGKAARLGYGLIKNHAMVDGNKRLGAHTMLVFLALNGIDLDYTQEELYTVILRIAAGEGDDTDLLTWILDHQA